MLGRGRSTSPQPKLTGRSTPSGSGTSSAPLATGALQQLTGRSPQVRPSGSGASGLGGLGPPGGPNLFSQNPVNPNPADGPPPTQDVPDVPFVRLMGFDNSSAKVKDFISFTEGEANYSIYGKINTVSNLLDWILYLLRQYISLGLSEAELYDLKKYIRAKLAHMGGEMDAHLQRKAMYIVDLLNYHVPDDAPPPLDENGNVLAEPKFPSNPYDAVVETTDPEKSNQLLLRSPEEEQSRAQAVQALMQARNTQRQEILAQLQGIKDNTMSNAEKRQAYAQLLQRTKVPRTSQDRRQAFTPNPISFLPLPQRAVRGGKRKTNVKRKTRSKKIGKRNTRR